MTSSLIGREHERLRVEAFLAAASERPAGLVLSGEPGIGKTSLWQHGVDAAEAEFAHVLVHRAVEAEAPLGLAALSDLLATELPAVADDLPQPRRQALEVALLLGEAPSGFVVDGRLLGLAVLDVLRVLAARGPLMLAVDDLQWVDRSSADALGFALRRLHDAPVGVLATLRLDWHAGSPRAPGAWLPAWCEVLELGPLGVGAVFRLLSDRAGIRLSRPRLARLHELVAGNPLFALALAPELSAAGMRADVPLPATVGEVLGRRLEQLSTEAREVLRVVAALRVAVVGRLEAELGVARTREGLEEASAHGIVVVSDTAVRFAHPLFASVLLERSLPWQRRTAHERAAGVADDVEIRARQLALAALGRDETVADELDSAATRAERRGAVVEAADLAELAVELTGDVAHLARRTLRTAELELRAGDRRRAVAIAEELVEAGARGVELADALFVIARCRLHDLATILSLCEQARTAATGDDRRTAEIAAFASWMRILAGDVPAALADAEDGLAAAERVGEPRLIAQAIARVAMAETWSLEETPDLLERGVEIERTLKQPLEFHASPRVALARRLVCVQELSRARPLLEAAEAAAAAVGDDGTRGHVLFHLAQLEIDAGRWREALADTEIGLDVAAQLDDVQLRGMILNIEAHACLLGGDVERARAALAEGLAIAAETRDALFELQHRGVLGFLELACGDAVAAVAVLADVPDLLNALGMVEASDLSRPAAIEALVESGELDRARTSLADFEVLASRSRGPWALASAARCRGLVAAADGDVEASRTAFAQALELHATVERPFDEAWTLLCFGRSARRQRRKRDAREALERALAILDGLAMPLWGARVRDELARLPGRRPAGTTLTPTEEQTARLAAAGKSNKQIAAQLFVSVNTVEQHLSSVYRKLGVTSRVALASRFATGADAATAGLSAGVTDPR